MTGTIFNLIQMYVAMILYYILKLPYGIRITVLFILSYGLVMCTIVTLYTFGKRILLPLIFYFSEWVIRLIQGLIFSIVKRSPSLEEKGSDFDEKLNDFGIRMESRRAYLKSNSKKHWRIIPFKKLFLVFSVFLCIFVIIPFYMEATVSGNTKQICSDINGFSENIQNNLWSFVNEYYTPAPKTITVVSEETHPQTEEVSKIILHLSPSGFNGANLRSSPDMGKRNIIGSVSGDVELYYENEFQKTGNGTWIKISMDGIDEAWINIGMIKTEDLAAAGIK